MATTDGLSVGLSVAELFSVRGKAALVTGGGTGIGMMIARGLVENGCRTYIASRKEAAAAAASLRGECGECIGIECDLSSEESLRALVETLQRNETRLHIIVNCAGANWAAPFADFPAAAWDKLAALNLKTPFLLTQALLPLLEKAASAADPARVINIGSIDGLRVSSLETYAYHATKAGLHHLTRALAGHLGRRHVTVNTIAPGPFPSKMMKATLKRSGEAIAAASALGRIGQPADVAGTVLYLASRAGAFTTGALIVLDGGQLVAPATPRL